MSRKYGLWSAAKGAGATASDRTSLGQRGTSCSALGHTQQGPFGRRGSEQARGTSFHPVFPGEAASLLLKQMPLSETRRR